MPSKGTQREPMREQETKAKTNNGPYRESIEKGEE
jgi:hypothetical protein